MESSQVVVARRKPLLRMSFWDKSVNVQNAGKPRFTKEEEEDATPASFLSWSDPMQLCLFWEDVRQGLQFFLRRPRLVQLGRIGADKRAQLVYVPLLTNHVAHGGNVGGTGPGPSLVFTEDTKAYRER
jgi:hypothetical protein